MVDEVGGGKGGADGSGGPAAARGRLPRLRKLIEPRSDWRGASPLGVSMKVCWMSSMSMKRNGR